MAGNSSGEDGGETPSSGIQASDKGVPEFDADDGGESNSSDNLVPLNDKAKLRVILESIYRIIGDLNQLSRLMREILNSQKQRSWSTKKTEHVTEKDEPCEDGCTGDLL